MLTWIRKSIQLLSEPAAKESILREFNSNCDSYVDNKDYSVWDKLDITEDEYQFIINHPHLVCLVPYCRIKGWSLPGKIKEITRTMVNAYKYATTESDVSFELSHYYWKDQYFEWLQGRSGYDPEPGSVKTRLENDNLALDMVLGFIHFLYVSEYE